MSKKEFIDRCIKMLNLLVVNHNDGKLELIDRTGKSDYSKVIDYTGNNWIYRYYNVETELAFAREQQSKY